MNAQQTQSTRPLFTFQPTTLRRLYKAFILLNIIQLALGLVFAILSIVFVRTIKLLGFLIVIGIILVAFAIISFFVVRRQQQGKMSRLVQLYLHEQVIMFFLIFVIIPALFQLPSILSAVSGTEGGLKVILDIVNMTCSEDQYTCINTALSKIKGPLVIFPIFSILIAVVMLGTISIEYVLAPSILVSSAVALSALLLLILGPLIIIMSIFLLVDVSSTDFRWPFILFLCTGVFVSVVSLVGLCSLSSKKKPQLYFYFALSVVLALFFLVGGILLLSLEKWTLGQIMADTVDFNKLLKKFPVALKFKNTEQIDFVNHLVHTAHSTLGTYDILLSLWVVLQSVSIVLSITSLSRFNKNYVVLQQQDSSHALFMDDDSGSDPDDGHHALDRSSPPPLVEGEQEKGRREESKQARGGVTEHEETENRGDPEEMEEQFEL
ncbi:hypothetical protein BLNAU_13386 [Blattamonas nauphoetae]|uniref:Transmembrane protein n=1 Tax=Blattamonas nauphoetae TaxID=2049346 RepID=A0ABQ9XJS4_9EUKA|nr:hypothetical protein BLNAU_13386 [Blattamonas nauphoetae]